MEEKDKQVLKEFYSGLHALIDYWHFKEDDPRKKLEGLAFSILCMLDGISGIFHYDLADLEKSSRRIQLHENFREKLGYKDERK